MDEIQDYLGFTFIFSAGMFLHLYSRMGKMQLPVLLHILVILIMSGQASECHLQLKLSQKLFVAFGTSLFLLSEALLA